MHRTRLRGFFTADDLDMIVGEALVHGWYNCGRL